MHRWVSEFINKHQDQWETEKREKELEICKELENWNKIKRLEKIKLLQKKWNRTDNSKETTDQVEAPEFPEYLRKDTHDIILDFIRSRPPLNPVSLNFANLLPIKRT